MANAGFTIVPAHDGRGSNAILCSPPDVIPLRFGNDSCRPHIATAEQAGLRPRIVRLEGIGMDTDEPEDLQKFASKKWNTRTSRFLCQSEIAAA